ncbi:MAG: hypothetical protein FWC44_03840 [Methanomassiliicoccaceae archaeon]|nr:hypothetical protein [Methanomassiliicoccaceae archaeon]
MLHLSRFPAMNPNEQFNIPFDLTQDGIASVLGISRAHVSLELKKLKDLGKIDDWRAHVKGSTSKRIVYYLLPDGAKDAEVIRKRIEAAGGTVEALLDMKRCDPGILWENLSPVDRETFGLACVFRVPITRKDIPETTTGVIPADNSGKTCIADDVREKFLKHADNEKMKVWHSKAADWWVDHGDAEDRDQERLFHLMKAGRNIEACKLALKSFEEFLENPNEDLLATLKGIAATPKLKESLYKLRAKIAIECGDTADALVCADVLADFLTEDADLIRAEVHMLTGKPDKGFELAFGQYNKKPSSGSALIAVKCLFRQKKYKEAADLVESSYKVLTEGADAAKVVDILILRAGIAYDRGKTEEALSYLSKAKKASRKDASKERIDSITANVKAGKPVNFF